MPEDTYNYRLNTVNIVVCIFNVVMPAIVWIYYGQQKYRAGNIAYDIE